MGLRVSPYFTHFEVVRAMKLAACMLEMAQSCTKTIICEAQYGKALNLAGTHHFIILDGTRCGGGVPPSKQSAVELNAKKPSDCSRWAPSSSGAFFCPSSKINPVMRGQRSSFGGIGNLLILQVHISKTIYCIETKSSPACSRISIIHPKEVFCSARHSKQNDLLFRCLDRIFVMYSIPEGNTVTLTRKIARGQTEWKALINIWNGKRPQTQVYVKNEP